MVQTVLIELRYESGGVVEKEVAYDGEPEEVAREIDRDNNALLEYMTARDDRGSAAFCFGGFMFRKAGLLTAQMRKPEW